MDEQESNQSLSPSVFIDKELEESTCHWTMQEVPLNSFGRHSAAILSTPNGRGRGRGILTRRRPNYPPGYTQNMSNIPTVENNRPDPRMVSTISMDHHYQNNLNGPNFNIPPENVIQHLNPVPLMIQIQPNMPNYTGVRQDLPMFPSYPSYNRILRRTELIVQIYF